jgi:hypothetical protein
MGLHPTDLCKCGLNEQTPAWIYSADLPQHVKSAALLAEAHCPKHQALFIMYTVHFIRKEEHIAYLSYFQCVYGLIEYWSMFVHVY